MTGKQHDSWPSGGFDPVISTLQGRYLPELGSYDIGGLLNDESLGRIAIVSSFGAESVVLIHYVRSLRPGIPVIFIDTEKHFPETLSYREEVTALLDVDVIVARAKPAEIVAEDPDGDLHALDPNACCTIRKTFPLQDALGRFDTWITGRKRYQSTFRAAVPVIERDGEKIKVNPLALWDAEDVDRYFSDHGLPRHPLEAQGFPSIGCKPCTRAVRAGEDARAGRWADDPDKTECGIHLGPDGRFRRSSKSN